MAYGVGERPEKSPASILFSVEYPISREDLVQAAEEAELDRDGINFLRGLPDRIYTSPIDVERQFAEAGARFGMGTSDVRHRENIGKDAVETGANPTRHP
jgi:hypothetical protein